MEYLKSADIVVALLTGRDVDSGTSAEIGYAYAFNKKIIGINANNIKVLNNFIWGLNRTIPEYDVEEDDFENYIVDFNN